MLRPLRRDRPPRMAELFDLPTRRIFTVSELTTEVRELLETTYDEIWIDGELSNFRRWRTGHVYFTLKDAGAQLQGVMFRSTARPLRFTPDDGLRVIVRGHLSVYEPKGEYQIVCQYMEPHGVGALHLAFEQLKHRLESEGLFAPSRKRLLPTLPRIIGVVTSLDGAALRDIIHVLRRRHPNAHLLIRPARVQGEGAGNDVAHGIIQITEIQGVDVVIVGRGGGSIEDLWAFNEEVVARAIVASSVPIISAVGHETDFTISDFVADVRAATPSAAAELAVAPESEFRERLDRMYERLRNAALMRIRKEHVRVRELDLRLEARDPRRMLSTIATRLAALEGRLAGAMTRQLSKRRESFVALVGRLENLNPLAVLGRGYAVCWNEDRSAVVSDAGAVETHDIVHVTLKRGELGCTVTTTTRSPRSSEG